MHNALLISEVLDRIVDHLVEDTVESPIGVSAEDTDKAGRRALVVLARSCRAFSEPALNAVWRRLHSLEPFLLCLPTKVSYDDTTVDGTLPAFNEKEWNIVLHYAPRVRELTLHRGDELSVKILQSLWFRTTLLLPNLRSLNWTYGVHTGVPSIRLLLSPSLVHLHMWLDDGDHTSVLAFLESYHILCPNIKSLELIHSPRFLDVTAAISRAISRCLNLENLGCSCIDEAALIHVTQLRCLKKFSSTLTNYQPDDLRRLASYGTPNHPLFENLRILELDIEDLSSIIPFLQSQHQPFEEITFRFHTVATPEVFRELFTTLGSATRRRTLRRIDLCSVIEHETPPQPVNFQVLSPLMTLNLHWFDLNIRNPISLNDNEFVQLVQAWPELEILDLGSEYRRDDYLPPAQIPTLRGLVRLLARCPKLHGLGLSLDATNIPSLSEAESLIRNTTITRLRVANPPIQEPVTRVAHFLLEHLPSLTAVMSFTRDMDYYRMWKSVDKEVGRIAGRPSSPDWDDEDVMQL